MRLNTIKPASGARPKKTRLGRGMGSGLGKTCGFGHKGQKARSGYSRKTGFEGGQLPLQRRLPKFGFNVLNAEEVAEIRLSDLNKVEAKEINLEELKKCKLAKKCAKRAKVILKGDIEKAVNLVGIKATAGARQAIEKAGGKVS